MIMISQYGLIIIDRNEMLLDLLAKRFMYNILHGTHFKHI